MKRKQHSAKDKFTVALEAATGSKTVNEVASSFGVHPSQVSQWKRQMLDAGPSVFSKQRSRPVFQADPPVWLCVRGRASVEWR